MPRPMTMNARERYLETLLFGTPDRVPFTPGGGRKSTLEAWRRQGLPADRDPFEFLCETIGVKIPPTKPPIQPDVDFRMMPIFEEKVLEHRPGHLIVQDWMGNVVEISDEYDATYIRNPVDFVTRRWHKFPVESPADFEEMKKRYNPDEPGRYPEDFAERRRAMTERDYATSVHFNGPFWQLREWCGFEPLCMLFAEQPEFVREMIEFWTDYVSRVLARVLEAGVVDRIGMSEDMAYKSHPMISPAMTREFLAPAYRRWVSEARQAGVPIIDMDSDGCIDLLIPIWIESDINVCDPIEVAAGCDLNAYRQRFGNRMAYAGGVDKRCIAKGGAVIEAELARLEPVLRDGGYIPSCDHGVPADISWPDFVHYATLLAEMTGWL